VIFIDRSVPRGVACALKAVRDDVAWLEDLYPHDAKDLQWLPDAGREGWLVISRDKKIRSRPGERRAILENHVGCFIIGAKRNLTKWEYLKLLAAMLDEMQRLFHETERPFIYMVHSTQGLRRVA